MTRQAHGIPKRTDTTQPENDVFGSLVPVQIGLAKMKIAAARRFIGTAVKDGWWVGYTAEVPSIAGETVVASCWSQIFEGIGFGSQE